MTQCEIVLSILRRLANPTSGDIEDFSSEWYGARIRGVTQRISDIRRRGGIIKVVKDTRGSKTLNRFILTREPNQKEGDNVKQIEVLGDAPVLNHPFSSSF